VEPDEQDVEEDEMRMEQESDQEPSEDSNESDTQSSEVHDDEANTTSYTRLYHLVLGGDKGYVYTTPPRGWTLLITSTGLNELAEGSDQTHKQPDPLNEDGVEFHRYCSPDWAIPRQVVERTICIVKRWAKLAGVPLYEKQGNVIIDSLVAIAAHCANLILRGDVIVGKIRSEQEMKT